MESCNHWLLERFHIQGNQVVFNHDGHDADFRVESDGNANMLYVDGSDNYVTIGHNTDLGGNLNVSGRNVASHSGTTFDPDTMQQWPIRTVFLGQRTLTGNGWGANYHIDLEFRVCWSSTYCCKLIGSQSACKYCPARVSKPCILLLVMEQ